MVGIQSSLARVAHYKLITLQCNRRHSTCLGVNIGILHKIIHHSSRQRRVYMKCIICWKVAAESHRARRIYLAVVLHALLDKLHHINIGTFGELMVVNLGEQQQSLIQSYRVREGLLNLKELRRLLLGKCRVIQQPLHTIAYDRQRSLQLVRRIAYELSLTLKSLLRAVNSSLQGITQAAELLHLATTGHRLWL